ncbi:hypothetical protein PV08_10761 [Exophiala spinifera]|uniref:Uncharacterized protein n=1 Tax=Exophiala spinifera TaxID=91928 RepID=A0A0D1Y914_9EURO|nr:uncharacterized protein PV08_10761 [Exophiala spinifera]KIW11461.1 hypothetical protein PV08_10761 [Exophiala spinifera]
MSFSSAMFKFLTYVVTLVVLTAAAVYFTGYADDVAGWAAKRYYKAKAIAEVKVLENVGSEKVESEIKESLKKNPVMGQSELDDVAGGLGQEAAQQGLGGVSSKLGGLGKF